MELCGDRESDLFVKTVCEPVKSSLALPSPERETGCLADNKVSFTVVQTANGLHIWIRTSSVGQAYSLPFQAKQMAAIS